MINDVKQLKSEVGVSIDILTASIAAGLSLDGITLSTPGLIGISVSAGRVEKIDTNIDI